MIIAGIDPSLTGNGICVVDRFCEDCTDFTITTIGEFGIFGVERLISLRAAVREFLCSRNVETVFLEDYSYGSKGKRLAQLCEWGGVLRMMLFADGIKMYTISPGTLKKFVTGRGQAKKEVMLEQTYRKWKVGSESLKNNDEVDAYCLARFGVEFLAWKDGEKTTQAKIAIFKKIL